MQVHDIFPPLATPSLLLQLQRLLPSSGVRLQPPLHQLQLLLTRLQRPPPATCTNRSFSLPGFSARPQLPVHCSNCSFSLSCFCARLQPSVCCSNRSFSLPVVAQVTAATPPAKVPTPSSTATAPVFALVTAATLPAAVTMPAATASVPASSHL